MNVKKFVLGMTAVAAVVGTSGQAQAAGYEKSIMWGGRSAGVAGIATPYMTGSQALYFNPAGLVGNTVGQDISLNVSPTSSQFKGPINNENAIASSQQSTAAPFGLIYGATINENLGFGIGGFISGGTNVMYENVPFTGYGEGAEVRSNLTVAEISAGAAYKVTEDLKIGLSWRFVMANAGFSSVSRVPVGGNVGLINSRFTDLEDTEALAFRVGAQYRLAEKTLLGLTYRSEVNFEAAGTSSVRLIPPGGGAGSTLTSTGVTARTTLPMQATLGLQHDFSDEWRGLFEYAWTQYSRVGEIPIAGTFAFGGADRSFPALRQNWQDQHNVRVGGEYLATSWPIRAGYGWTSTVTDPALARASFTPPGPAHTVTVGTGQTFSVFESPVQFDAGFEYTTTEGDGEVNAADPNIRPGTYSAAAYALHLGLTYAF